LVTEQVDQSATRPRLPLEIWVLVASAFVIAVGYGLVAPALPTFARSFNVGVTAASFVVSSFAIFRLSFAPVSGRLVTRLGELRVYLVGLLIVSISTGACAFAHAYWQLLLYRALGGIGSTMFTVAAVSLLVRLAPAEMRGRASGLWATGFLLGNIAGPLIGGALIVVSLRAPFIVYAVALLIAIAITGLLLRGREGVAARTGEQATVMRLRDALRHPTFRAALSSSFANGWLVFGVRVALVPLFVVEVLAEQPSWAGISLAVFAAGNASTLILSGRIADRRGRRPPMLVGLVLCSIGTACLGLTTSLPAFLAASLLTGIGSGLINPPMTAAVADVIGSRARGGPVLAGFQMAADLGAILGPVLAGAIAEVWNFSAAFAVTAAVSLVALVFWWRAPETLPSHATHTAQDAAAESGPLDEGPPVPLPAEASQLSERAEPSEPQGRASRPR
jgi:MFS family permease